MVLLLVGCGSGSKVSTDVILQNATAHATFRGDCTPPQTTVNEPCTQFELTFAVSNHATKGVDHVQDVQLSTGGQPVQMQKSIECAGAPWNLAPGATSGVVDLELALSPHGSLQAPCGTVGSEAVNVAQTPATAADSFDIIVTGVLADATPFLARTTAPIR